MVLEHTQNGDNYFKEGNYLDAIVEYQQVINRDSSNVYAPTMIDSANIFLQEAFNREQAAAVSEAVNRSRAASDSAFVDLHFERGRRLLNQNQFSEAILEFNNALERDPDNPTLRSAIATARRRRVEESRRKIEQARTEMNNQNYTNALVILADARTLAGNNASLNQQIVQVEGEVSIQQKLQQGISLFQINEYSKALEMFDEVLRLDPENETALEYQRRAKIETISKETTMDEATQERYLQGMQMYMDDQYQEAIRIWEEILIEQPYNKKVLKAVQGAKDKMAQGGN